MVQSNKIILTLYSYIKQKSKIFSLLILSLSLLFASFFVFKVFDISAIPILNDLYHIANYINGIIIVLFLPLYPLFFFILNFKDKKLVEKCAYTFVSNLSFYIICGYLGQLLGLTLNSIFFFLVVIIMFIALVMLAILTTFKHYSEKSLKVNSENISQPDISLKKFIRKFLFGNINLILLCSFLFLLGILFLVAFSVFHSLDSLYHITIIKVIDTRKQLPLDDYFGSMGLHIIGIVFHYFSGVDFLEIPKFYVFYSIPIFSVILYILLKKIFKNKNIAIFGVFFIEGGSVIIIRTMNIFWPTGLTLCQMLFILYLLYSRAEKFIEKDTIEMSDITQNIMLTYPLIITLFISSILTHSLIALILLISYAWVFLLYFIRDFRRGIDIFIIIILFLLIFIFILLDLGVGHLRFLILIDPQVLKNLNIYFILFGLGGVFIGILIIRKYVRNIKFTNKMIFFNFTKNEIEYVKKFEKKFIIPFVTFLIVGVSIVLFSVNPWFGFLSSKIILFVKFTVVLFLGMWGYKAITTSSKGQFLFRWFIGGLLLVFVGTIFDVLFLKKYYFGRIIEISMFFLLVGFVAYWYKLYKLGLIKQKIFKIFLTFIITFSLIGSFMEMDNYEQVNRRDLQVFQQYAKYSNDSNVFLIEYGFQHGLNYFYYPYEKNNNSIRIQSIQIYVFFGENEIIYDYLDPDTHINENGENILQKLKKKYQTDVFFLLTERVTTSAFINDISIDALEKYYNMSYLSRVYSAKAIDGKERPLYWIV
ncbi:MAG: hypothetical protein GF316_18200 [Candidatus Lokiarchaeota archaeon]|nr:hypothetical protein [Candidatus Lokiarchaeota archaeon]